MCFLPGARLGRGGGGVKGVSSSHCRKAAADAARDLYNSSSSTQPQHPTYARWRASDGSSDGLLRDKQNLTDRLCLSQYFQGARQHATKKRGNRGTRNNNKNYHVIIPLPLFTVHQSGIIDDKTNSSTLVRQ